MSDYRADISLGIVMSTCEDAAKTSYRFVNPKWTQRTAPLNVTGRTEMNAINLMGGHIVFSGHLKETCLPSPGRRSENSKKNGLVINSQKQRADGHALPQGQWSHSQVINGCPRRDTKSKGASCTRDGS